MRTNLTLDKESNGKPNVNFNSRAALSIEFGILAHVLIHSVYQVRPWLPGKKIIYLPASDFFNAVAI